jgi:hypothetical protein
MEFVCLLLISAAVTFHSKYLFVREVTYGQRLDGITVRCSVHTLEGCVAASCGV